ncbi:hypothetical protein OS493_025552, partial [Desmophyllum pertusum]
DGWPHGTDGCHNVQSEWLSSRGCRMDGPHGTDGSHDVQSGWLNSRGCRMDGLMEQTVVTMCSLDGSIVAVVGRMDGLMEHRVVTMCSLDGSTVVAV